MGGSLPNGVPVDFYARAIEQAHVHNVPVIFDSSGPSLAAGIKSRPSLIKPNLPELADVLGFIPKSQPEVQQAAGELKARFGVDAIATLGEEGAVAVFEDGAYFVKPLSIPVVSAAGAGDGVLAGMALSYANQESHEYGLRHGFALAGAILKTLATADYRVEEYKELLQKICILPL
jgi:fructose-1-phosphate kinase PfkB-like protein